MQLAGLSLLDTSASFNAVDHNIRTPFESKSGRSVGLSPTLMDVHNPSICQGRRRHPNRSPVVRRVPQGSVLAVPSKLYAYARAHKSRDKRTQENMKRTHKLITRQRTLSPWSDGYIAKMLIITYNIYIRHF